MTALFKVAVIHEQLMEEKPSNAANQKNSFAE